MSLVTSEAGIPVHAGEPLKLTANYDDALPHTRVMGIMGLYITPDATAGPACGPLPSDLEVERIPGPSRPPPFPVPVRRPRGRAVLLGRGATVDVGAQSFSPANVAVRQGARVRWRFWDAALHNVTLADGPAGFSSPNLSDGRTYETRLTKPGVYRLYCSLHATTMASTITVLPARR
jgi:plastocyanin